MEVWLKQTVLTHTPVDFGYDTTLWTRDMLAELLKKEFGVAVSGSTVSLHLRKLGLSYQQPAYQDRDRNPGEVERFLNDKFPKIQRLADKLGADIGFEDEAGVGIMTRSGRTWGLVGKTPVVRVCTKRGGYNVLSMVTPKGEMKYSVTANSIDSVHYSPVPYEKHRQAASCRGLLTPPVSSNNLRIVSNARCKGLSVSSLSGTKLNS